MLKKALQQNEISEVDTLTIGKQIRKGRKRLDLTQQQMAEKIGISSTALALHERDEMFPSRKHLLKYKELIGSLTL